MLHQISALEHVHKSGLVHCDLKRGTSSSIPPIQSACIWSTYGFTRAITSTTQTTNTLAYRVVGTLPYASLNMHDGIRKLQYLYYKPASNPGPAPRDDVESLGYTFLNLARGDLPWSYNVR